MQVPHDDSPDAEMRKVMDVNAVGSALITLKHAVKAFRARGGGDIIFSSSLASLLNQKTYLGMQAGPPEDADTASHLIAYSASKAAVDAVARGAAGAYKAYNVRVLNLNIAVFKSEMSARAAAGMKTDVSGMAAGFNPAVKEAGDPAEIARVILAFADGTSKWQSGSSIVVDNHVTIDAHLYYSRMYRPDEDDPLGLVPLDKSKPHLCDVAGNPATLKEEL